MHHCATCPYATSSVGANYQLHVNYHQISSNADDIDLKISQLECRKSAQGPCAWTANNLLIETILVINWATQVKIPLAPRPYATILDDLIQANDLALLTRLLTPNHPDPGPGNRYLHWDELRHRTPPEGLTPEQWWFQTKSTRRMLSRKLPFRDTADSPFQFALIDPVLAALHRIDRDASGQIRMDTPIANPERRDAYLVSSLIEEAITSSQLEGASTPRKVAKEMLRQGRKPGDRSERMIYNNFVAMQAIRERTDEPLTPGLIFDLHRLLTEGTLDDPTASGRLRRSEETIEVVDHRDNRILHTPPPAGELAERLESLCRFANDREGAPFLHPLVRAILLHFVLAYDHPFVDGNGRVARALFYWSALSQGFWLMEFITISNVLRKAPGQYARAYLFTETDDGDTTYFILHQLETILKAMDSLHAYLGRKAREMRRAEAMLGRSAALRHRLNHRQIALLQHALKHPDTAYTIEGHRQSHNVVYQTARSDLLDLEQSGLLHKEQAGRAFLFHAPRDLRERLENLGR